MSWKLRKKAKGLLEREDGTVFKDRGGKVSVVLVYPNSYSAGMSNLALHTLYNLLNSMSYCLAERAFLPEPADVKEFKRTNKPLFSIESQRPLRDFDIIAFSVSFEEDYLNLARILALAHLPVFSKDRAHNNPLIIGGGAALTLNPEPVADLLDLIVAGEGEAALISLLEAFKTGSSVPANYANIDGLYVPSLYEPVYDGARQTALIRLPGAPQAVVARKSLDIDDLPLAKSAIITPDTGFASTTLIEIEKGCGRLCRFCAAGFLYMPPRWRDFDSVKKAIQEAIDKTGKVGLIGAAVSEYPRLKELLREAIRMGGELTLSSIRADLLDAELLALLKACGYKTLTIAPEAGSERMRKVINKCMSEATIIHAVELAEEAGFKRLKLYFLAGLPGETDCDTLAISALTKKARDNFKGTITISINPFIPKPATPFQWHSYERIEVIEARFKAIRHALKDVKGLKVKIFSPREAFFQSALARGDRRLARVIVEATLHESKTLKRAFKKLAGQVPDVSEYVYRQREKDELLPWDIIEHGIRKNFLWKEYQRALKAQESAPCDVGNCTRCGVC